MATRERLTVSRGEPLRKAWALRNTATDEPLDLDGYQARVTIRRYSDSPDTVLECLSGPEVTTVNIGPTPGLVTLTIPAEVTRTWTWQRALYDLDLIRPDGTPTTLRAGEVIVNSEVGR